MVYITPGLAKTSLQEVSPAYFFAGFLSLFFDDFLRNWIPQGMGNRAAADSKFGSDILLLPALEVKLDDLHVNRLQALQRNMICSWHGAAHLSATR